MKKIKKCIKCLLPETFPKAEFNKQGICNFCLSHETLHAQGEAKLKKVLQAKKGKMYDCVVPISGGKDSTYVLYYAVKNLNLRVIAVNYDSGFQSSLSIENMKNACNILDVPLVFKKADYNAQMLRSILRISEILGLFFGACRNCEVNIRTSAINTARDYNVPFILYGSSTLEDSGIHPFFGWKAFIRNIPIRGAMKVSFHLLKYSYYSIRQRMQMKVPLKYRFLLKSGLPFPKKKIRVIHFFDYIEWDGPASINFLKKQLGWQSPAHHEFRFDCLLHCFVNHRWLQASGISSDGFIDSKLIRESLISREDAISKEEVIMDNIKEECLGVIEELGLIDYIMPNIKAVDE